MGVGEDIMVAETIEEVTEAHVREAIVKK